MVDIQWEDPPLSRAFPRGKPEHVVFVEALKSRPGQWAIFRDKVSHGSTATHVLDGHLAAFRPPGAFEATTRSNPDGTYRTYVRYIGEV